MLSGSLIGIRSSKTLEITEIDYKNFSPGKTIKIEEESDIVQVSELSGKNKGRIVILTLEKKLKIYQLNFDSFNLGFHLLGETLLENYSQEEEAYNFFNFSIENNDFIAVNLTQKSRQNPKISSSIQILEINKKNFEIKLRAKLHIKELDDNGYTVFRLLKVFSDYIIFFGMSNEEDEKNKKFNCIRTFYFKIKDGVNCIGEIVNLKRRVDCGFIEKLEAFEGEEGAFYGGEGGGGNRIVELRFGFGT